jgi:hemerythrin-like domain-containing protein
MCSYCGCHDIGPIAVLADEHIRIQNLMGEIRRSALRGDGERAAAMLGQLRTLLDQHDEVEELSLYPSMARHEEFSDKVGSLFDEHDELHDVIERALATVQATGAADVEWPPVLAVFDVLMEHIQAEENGLFPAAAIALDVPDWERAEQVRRDYEAAHPSEPG